MAKMDYSAKTYDWIFEVALTIANLEGAGEIDTPLISEAIQLRNLNRLL